MSMKKRLAALLMAGVMVFSLPAAVFAASQEGGTLPDSSSSTVLPEPTADPTDEPVATPTEEPTATPTAEPTSTPTVEPTKEPAKHITNLPVFGVTGYRVGNGGEVSEQASIAVNASDVVLHLFTDKNLGNEGDTVSIVLKNCNFVSVGVNAKLIKENCIEVSGLRYADNTGNRFYAEIGGQNVSEYIAECAVKSPDAVDPDDPNAGRVPGLIVKSSSIGADVIDAGAEFKLSLTIYATASGKLNAEDVIVSITPAAGLVITSGSSTQYIGTMRPGEAKTVSFPMRALADFTEGVSTVSVSVTGTDVSGTPTTVSVPISQPDRFEITRVEMPEQMMTGEENYATIYFVNKGKNSVNNITVSLEGENLTQPLQSQYVGNLGPGTEDSVDLDLCAVEAGQITGTVTISYEAPSGEVVNVTEAISIPVEEYYDPYIDMMPDDMMGDDVMMEDPGMQQSGFAWWQIVLLVVLAAAVIVAVVVVMRKRKAKKAALLEESDEDF